VIYVKASTGLSAGLVIDGRVFRGAMGSTGALGHMSVAADGPACPCGSRGCLEMYSAVPAVLAALKPMYGVLTFDQVLEMVDAGNRACVRALRDAAITLGRGLAGVCNLLNPDRVVIGGDLARAGEVFLSPLWDGLEQHALPIATEQLGVVRGELGERAGALGGVALILRETT
jgi:predicted NBD/HSP70 family sugar kinase